jgi:hypothetical protein
LAISTARSTAALWPETTTCAGSLSLAAWQTSPCAASAATAHRRLEIETQQRRHRAFAHRHRLLHRLAADAQQPRGIRQAQRARRA